MNILLVVSGGVTTMLIYLIFPMDTKQEEIKFMSLNVNDLGNPVKRAKIMTKFKKEKTQINFLK